MKSLYVCFLMIFFSLNTFSQELNIKINNQFFYLNGSFFDQDIVINNDTTIFLNSGIYNFYNDSIDFVIYIDGSQDSNLTFSNHKYFFDGLDDKEFQFLNHFFSYYKSLVSDVSLSGMNPDEYEILMYDVKHKLNIFLKKKQSELELLKEDFRTLLINYVDLIYYNSLCEYILKSTNFEEKFNYKLIPYFLDESFYFDSVDKNFNFFLFKFTFFFSI